MNHHFVTTYFNPCGYDIRRKLTQEFVKRYPNVCLLTNSNDILTNNKRLYETDIKGHIDYILINKYIKDNPDLQTLTIIDSDLILEPLFFTKVIEKHKQFKGDVPFMLQCFKDSYELIGSTLLKGPSSMLSQGHHSGFVLSFNKTFLNKFPFSEDFLLGGYDYFLCKSVVGIALSFPICVRQTKIQATYDFVQTDVIHNAHGSKLKRLTPWESYENLTQDVIEDYFKSRLEI